MPTRAKNVFTPKEAESVRRIEQTVEDREEFRRQWKEDREHKEKIKNERYKAIQERRKKNNPDGKGRGINIEVTGK